MSIALSRFTSPGRQFMNPDRSTKPKMLVVDDEPDNLDLLYRTFRRDFIVLRAESGLKALNILAAEGEVAVIISDQRMPEMKGTEFLSKTVPQFPDTMRIILTGFTDVEDLVEAINAGQVYKYITKPWDPSELKVVVQRAAETYELLKQRTEELHCAQAQTLLLSTIVQAMALADQPNLCLQAVANAIGEAFQANRCRIQRVEGETWGIEAMYSMSPLAAVAVQPLSQNGGVKEAIATQTIQIASQFAKDGSNLSHAEEMEGQLVAPIFFRGQVQAVLLLQWQRPCSLRQDELTLIELAAQQIGMALACAQRCPP